MNIEQWIERGSWRSLQALAHEMVVYAEQHAGGAQMRPLLGGGTRLMLALHHRVSDDIDLFVRDPQWLSYLSPRVNDRFAEHIQSYDETGEVLKINCPLGQIDFIVRPSLLGLEPETAAESVFELEACSEVVAKKLFYRGDLLTSRDLFDWMAVADRDPTLSTRISSARLIDERRLAALQARLHQMQSFPQSVNQWSAIRPSPALSLNEALAWAMNAAPSLLRSGPVYVHDAPEDSHGPG